MKKFLKSTLAMLIAAVIFSPFAYALSDESVPDDSVIFDISTLADGKMTFGEFAGFLVDYFDMYDLFPSENKFSDVPEDDENAVDLLRLVSGGYIMGNGDGTVGFYDIVTKSRAFTVISRIAEKKRASDENDFILKASNVTDIMCSPYFWLSKKADTDKVILSPEQIREVNRKTLAKSETYTIDLSKRSENYDGKKMIESLGYSPVNYPLYIDGGKEADTEYFEGLERNIKNSEVSENMTVRYAFTVNSTVMKAYPYEEILSDEAGFAESDEFVNTGIHLNEPLVTYFLSADKKFVYADCSCCSGWIPEKDVAYCESKDEWEKIRAEKDFIVVTGEKVYLEHCDDEDISEKAMTMGTVLPIDKNPETPSFRLAYNSYAVKIPCRGDGGRLFYKSGIIPSNRDISVGFLPYTTDNVVKQAFKFLGDRYSWGGAFLATDCSEMAQDIYSCFGFVVPRNDAWQVQMPVHVINVSEKTDDEKKAILLSDTPPGAILEFPGHIMIYLGENDGLYYDINNVSSFYDDLYPEKGKIKARCTLINDLSTKRANGKTWLTSLANIIIVK